METFLSDLDSQLFILLNVFIAMILGGIIGLERELARKPAGLRTLMLVAGASAMLVGLTDTLIDHFSGVSDNRILRADPVRIVEAIITGVSFICAGTIFRSGSYQGIEGLTTAAAILICCAIGIAVALNQWVLAVGVSLLAILILRSAAALERSISSGKR